MLFTGFLLEHNLPFESAAHAGPLFHKMFPDSAIAKRYGCGATKTAAIVNYAMGPEMKIPVVDYLKQHPFSLAVDGSSDTGTESMYPLVVRIFDMAKGEVCSKFWHMCLVSDSSAVGIFTQIKDAFQKYNIPWENIIGLSLDNASVNMGKHKGLYRHFEKHSSGIYTAGCACHIIHNTASYSSKAFTVESRFSVDDFLVDLFYYFDQSTKRQSSLKEYCGFCDQEYRKLLKYGSTRWLSREACIDRALKQYPSLTSYFASQKEISDTRLSRLKQYFADPRTEIYLLFYSSVLPLFTEVNKLLQYEEPKIHVMSSELTSFMYKLLGRFLLVSAYKDRLITDIDIDDSNNFLPDQQIMIGFTTRSYIQKHCILPAEEKKIISACKSFYVAAYRYATSHLPFSDEVLKHAEVLQFEQREVHVAGYDSLVYFVKRFPILTTKLEGKLDVLYDQWVEYHFCPMPT